MAETEIRERFGEALKRVLDGRTMTWLADRTGISLGRLYRLADGRTEPVLADVEKICAVLSVPASTFVVTEETTEGQE